MCNADKSMTVAWLSTEACNPSNTNCHWPPIIKTTPATLLQYVTSGWCHFPELHHPIRCSNNNMLFSLLTTKIYYSAYSPAELHRKGVPLGSSFLWGELLACEWGVLCVPPLSSLLQLTPDHRVEDVLTYLDEDSAKWRHICLCAEYR